MAAYDQLLKEAGEASVRAARGTAEAAQREAVSTQRLSAKTQGLYGPIAQALESKTRGQIAAAVAPSIAQAEASGKINLANAQLQRDMAFQQMIGNIVGGLGSAAGSFAAAGIGVPAAPKVPTPTAYYGVSNIYR